MPAVQPDAVKNYCVTARPAVLRAEVWGTLIFRAEDNLRTGVRRRSRKLPTGITAKLIFPPVSMNKKRGFLQ